MADEHGESWLFQGKRFPVTAGAFPPEKRPQPFQPLKWSEIPASCYDPKARIESMNIDRVAAALTFPNLPEFAGNLFQRSKDRDLALLCIQACNDWLLDEWCMPCPDRFIGLALGSPARRGRGRARDRQRCAVGGVQPRAAESRVSGHPQPWRLLGPAILADNVMIETDFPHNATWFPHSMEKAQETLAHVSAGDRHKILCGHAERLFQLQPATIAA